jgi:hypothetical protein
VEIADHRSRRSFSIGLMFERQPSKEQLDARFPTGSLLGIEH